VSVIAFILCVVAILYIYSRQIIRHKSTLDGYKRQLDAYKKLIPDLGSIIPMSHFREVVDEKNSHINEISLQLSTIEKELSELKSQQQSKSVRLGQISEHCVSLLPNFPFDIKNMRFLGSPIDFIAFDFDNEVIHFIEVKTGKSKLNDRQKIIKRIVGKKNIKFSQITITETGIKYEDDGNHIV
jgi:predicted Holliday junction resolvase-like endonuclease